MKHQHIRSEIDLMLADPNMPMPGARAALERGCTCCPQMNEHGLGCARTWAGDESVTVYRIAGNCPVHGR